MRMLRRLVFVTAALLVLGCDAEVIRTDAGTTGPSDGGEEECASPRTVCGSQCVDLSSDTRHCGECNERCDDGAFCSMGACQTSCASPRTACGDACVDLATSADHCGDCGNACAADEACAMGVCSCASALTECGGACVDTQTSSGHCGECDNACGAMQICDAGSCENTVEFDCLDGVDDDGDGLTDCEDPDCEGTTRMCTCSGGAEPPPGVTPEELCESTGWSECGPCGPPPECSAASPCDYGFSCVSSECVFEPSTVFDLVVVSAEIPRPVGGGDWDTGSGPDVFASLRVGPMMESAPELTTSRLDDDYFPSWNETIIRSTSAADFRTYTRVDIWDYDLLNPNDLIGACTLTFATTSFDGSERVFTCPATAETPGWRLRLRFVQP